MHSTMDIILDCTNSQGLSFTIHRTKVPIPQRGETKRYTFTIRSGVMVRGYWLIDTTSREEMYFTCWQAFAAEGTLTVQVSHDAFIERHSSGRDKRATESARNWHRSVRVRSAVAVPRRRHSAPRPRT